MQTAPGRRVFKLFSDARENRVFTYEKTARPDFMYLA
jgi:hypothetical protein